VEERTGRKDDAMRKRGADIVFNEVYSYGGFPMRLGDIITDMDTTAKQLDKKNWFRIREAGLSGLMQRHKYQPLTDTEPISLEQFYQLTGIKRSPNQNQDALNNRRV